MYHNAATLDRCKFTIICLFLRVRFVRTWQLPADALAMPFPLNMFRPLRLAREHFATQFTVWSRRWFHVPPPTNTARATPPGSASHVAQMLLPARVLGVLRVARKVHLAHLAPRSIRAFRQAPLEFIFKRPRRVLALRVRARTSRNRRAPRAAAALAPKPPERPITLVIVPVPQQPPGERLYSR